MDQGRAWTGEAGPGASDPEGRGEGQRATTDRGAAGDGYRGIADPDRLAPGADGPAPSDRARDAGLVEVVGHEGGQPVWDLTERGERVVGAIRADAPRAVIERVVSGGDPPAAAGRRGAALPSG